VIYQDPRYIKFQAKYEKANIIQAGGMPLLLKDKNAFAPYGYGGPSENFLYDKFINDLKNMGANHYFIRFAPWLENHKLFPANKVKYSRKTVARDLMQPIKFGHGTESSIKKTLGPRFKNKCEIIHGYEALSNDIYTINYLYNITMERKQAEICYKYNFIYFKDMFKLLNDNIDLFLVKNMVNKYIAFALFVFDETNVYYHYSGTDIEYKEIYPMECIIDKACRYYQKQGKKLIHFGGGLKEDDSLFRFKQKFGNLTFDYYIADGNT